MRQQEIEKLRQENQRLTNSYSIPSEDWSRLKDELQRQNVTVEKYQKTIEADRLLHKSQMVKIRDEYQRELSCVVCLDKRVS